jgi:hypothetical protein
MSAARETGFESADLGDVILNAIRSAQLEINTAMPATVTSYDNATQTCTVQPSFKRIFIRNEQVVSRAEISDVPVMFQRAGSYSFTYPIAAGDPVLLIFSQRSLDDWLDFGGEVVLTDTRLHNINDAIAIPGLFPATGAMVPPPLTAAQVSGPKVFVGDPAGLITPIATAAGGPAGALLPSAPTTIPVGKLELVQIMEAFMTLMLNCSYGGVVGAGGGGIDTVTKVVLQQLITDLGGLKA